jgi:hypothetical protein
MRRPAFLLFTLLGLLLFQAGDAHSQFHTPEETAAVKKAEEFALRAARERADGFLESAERSAMESLRILPRRPHHEEARAAYRKQLAGILVDLLTTAEASSADPGKPEAEYQPSAEIEDKVPFLLGEALAVDQTEREWDDISDVEDKVPYLGQYLAGTSPASREIRLPKVEFQGISLREALATLAALSKEHDTNPLEADRGVWIHLDAPSVVVNTAITLTLTDVPLSEAIERTAEQGACRAFHSNLSTLERGITISCVDLMATADGKMVASPAVARWHEAFWKLQNAESAAATGNRSRANYFYRQALNLYAILSVRFPEFHPDIIRETMKDIADKLEGKSPSLLPK